MFWGTLPMGLATIVVSTRSQARERAYLTTRIW
jgi:hypothetical protein